jgi:UDPglucose--hexose-1-phosphate uridylyltransferase
MELRRQVVSAEILRPDLGFASARSTVEIRWDPLTGHTSRLLAGSSLLPLADFDLQGLADQTRQTCPFCPERLERVTPMLPPAIWPEGRIRRGEAVLFPNLLAYSQYSSVSVYSPERHLLRLDEMTAELVADNLATQVAFAQAVMRQDDEARWASVNANHMLPSGSSVFHPHMQGAVNPVASTAQRLLADAPRERFGAYMRAEKRDGRRYLGSTGNVDWLASFAPLGPGELRAFVFGVASPTELDDALVAELGHGIALALGLYAELGFGSFNMAIYGAPPRAPGYPLNLRLVCRSSLEPLYRSDATWMERLHWEAAVDVWPEELADRAGDRFGNR